MVFSKTGVDDEISEQQRDAVVKVRSDMAELCGYVTDSLNSFGVEFVVFPPSEWANGNRKELRW